MEVDRVVEQFVLRDKISKLGLKTTKITQNNSIITLLFTSFGKVAPEKNNEFKKQLGSYPCSCKSFKSLYYLPSPAVGLSLRI